MSWETRQGKRVYYRARKIRGRVVRTYVGTGIKGERAAAKDALRRAERETQHNACRAIKYGWQTFDTNVVSATAPIDLLFRATLIGAGYWQHERGEWRRRRNVSIN